jgi:hypothetical protein
MVGFCVGGNGRTTTSRSHPPCPLDVNHEKCSALFEQTTDLVDGNGFILTAFAGLEFTGGVGSV